MLPSWSLQKEALDLKPSDIRLIIWKNFRASFMLPCISISSHSSFTNSCFFLRNKWRSSLLFSLYGTSCSWLQCGLVCVILLNCCLATLIVEPSWLLLSTISNLSSAAVCREWAMYCHCVLTSGSGRASWRSYERRMENNSAFFCERSFWTSSMLCTDLNVMLHAQRRVRSLAATRNWLESMLATRRVHHVFIAKPRRREYPL